MHFCLLNREGTTVASGKGELDLSRPPPFFAAERRRQNEGPASYLEADMLISRGGTSSRKSAEAEMEHVCPTQEWFKSSGLFPNFLQCFSCALLPCFFRGNVLTVPQVAGQRTTSLTALVPVAKRGKKPCIKIFYLSYHLP